MSAFDWGSEAEENLMSGEIRRSERFSILMEARAGQAGGFWP